MTITREQAVARHPHLASETRAGCVRVDMHVHTMWSGDATTTPDELAAAVAAAGLDVVCITDHSTTNGAFELARSGALGCRVVVGEELRTPAGELIGLFLTDRIPNGVSADEFVARVRDQGGLVYVPHPFDPMRRNLQAGVLEALASAGRIDAVEVLNAKTSLPSLNERAARFATAHGLAAGAGSDAHVPEAIGAAFVEMPDFSDASSFLAALSEGAVAGHHSDPPRAWRPRIVPSTRAL